MSRKALGRGLGDLLHRALPARAVSRAAASDPNTPAPTPPGSVAAEAASPVETHAQPIPATTGLHSQVTPAPSAPGPSALSNPQKVDRPSPAARLPRFGPSYTPPPEPAQPPGRGFLYLVLVVDVLLIAFAAAMAFGPWVQRPVSLYLAAAAVLAGGTLACGAIVYQASPHRPPSGSPKPSRVRVRLTRL